MSKETEAVIPQIGDTVHWKWYSSVIDGVVQEMIPHKAEIISKGKYISRNGTPENPAVIIEHKSGNPVIKLASELIPTQRE